MGPRISRVGKVVALAALALLLVVAPWAAAAEPPWCHRVRPGETLSGLAARHRSTVEVLLRLNPGAGSGLRAGQILSLPALARLRSGALPLVAGPLTARPGSLLRENAAADRQRLSRLQDMSMVRRFVRAGLLLPLARETPTFVLAGVPAELRVTRPWTKRFIQQLAAGMQSLFGSRLRVTSLTRTVSVQRELATWNGNAAPAEGIPRSTHLTGAAVDISTRFHAERELAWLRVVLGRLARGGVLTAVEEVAQPHFHILVFRQYLAYARALPSPLLIGGC